MDPHSMFGSSEDSRIVGIDMKENNLNGVRSEEIDQDVQEKGQFEVVYTNMRDPASPSRTAAASTVKFDDHGIVLENRELNTHSSGKPALWLTPPLSGCSVMITRCENEYSMIHMQPDSDENEYQKLKTQFPKDEANTRYGQFQQERLDRDIATTLRDVAPGTSYIMVPSMQSQKTLQVVGVVDYDKHEIDFYKQESEPGCIPTNAEKLNWTDYSASSL